jgi:LPPG:FO 2-phospho-L-lactate transferase
VAFRPVVALAGGVGAARFLTGLVQVVPPEQLTVIVNTGDDRDFFGLRVCPDLDIVTYTLAGRVNRETGWGLADDRFECLGALQQLRSDAWFRLGDRDLATHIHRSERLRSGQTLVEITAGIADSFGVHVELLPMSEDAATTIIVRGDGSRCDFEEYLVRDGSPDDVAQVDLALAERAQPAPGVIEAIRNATQLLICPSNPIVSIAPIRAVRGVEAALRERADAVAVSPIIGGRPVKGPADRLLRAQGTEVSARGVAGLYSGITKAMVIDEVDVDQLADLEALGLRALATQTLMTTPEIAKGVAEAALSLCAEPA